jgi:ferrous iron transport protein B
MRNGLESLQAVIDQAVADSPIPRLKIEYDPALEVAIANLTPLLDKQAQNQGCDLRWLAVRLLEDDTLAIKIAGKGVADQVKKLQLAIEHETDDEIDILAADARYTFVNKLTQGSVCRLNEVSQLTSDKIDRIV